MVECYLASITRAAGCLALATPGQWWRQHAATLQCDVAPFSRSARRMGRWHTTTKEWTLWSHCCCSCPGPGQAIQASYGPNSGDWAFGRFYEGSILAVGRCVNGCQWLPIRFVTSCRFVQMMWPASLVTSSCDAGKMVHLCDSASRSRQERLGLHLCLEAEDGNGKTTYVMI